MRSFYPLRLQLAKRMRERSGYLFLALVILLNLTPPLLASLSSTATLAKLALFILVSAIAGLILVALLPKHSTGWAKAISNGIGFGLATLFTSLFADEFSNAYLSLAVVVQVIFLLYGFRYGLATLGLAIVVDSYYFLVIDHVNLLADVYAIAIQTTIGLLAWRFVSIALDSAVEIKRLGVVAADSEIKAKRLANVAIDSELEAKRLAVVAIETRVEAKRLAVIAIDSEVEAKRLAIVAIDSELEAKRLATVAVETRIEAERLATVAGETRVEAKRLAVIAIETRVEADRLAAAAIDSEKLANVAIDSEAKATLLAAQITKLNRILFTSQETERKRLARDIHDGPLQAMGVELLAIDRIKRRLEMGDHEAVILELEFLREIATETVDDLRDTVNGLRNTILDRSLELALKNLARKTLFTTELEIEIDIRLKQGGDQRGDRGGGAGGTGGTGEDLGTGEAVLPKALEACLYQLSVEALNNVKKHARARHVYILIEELQTLGTAGPDVVKLTISDDGAGFDYPTRLNEALESGHIGLYSMNERCTEFDGVMEVISAAGEGTRLTFTFPRDISVHTTGQLRLLAG